MNLNVIKFYTNATERHAYFALSFFYFLIASIAQASPLRCEEFFPKPSHFQELAWQALENGDSSLFEFREKEIESRLLQEKPTSSLQPLLRGSSEAYRVELEGGLIGVFKPAQKYWTKRIRPFHDERAPQRSRAAWLLDRLVGANLIPVTVLREINGQWGSLQIFVNPDRLLVSEKTFRSLRRLQILDFFVAGWDRPKNKLQVQNGWAGIDYDLSFLTKPIHISFGIAPPPSLENIKNFMLQERESFHYPLPEKVQAALKDLLTDEEIEATNQRLKLFFGI